jgi:hypothetical protein
MTVAGNYAKKGRTGIAIWCYEELGSLLVFIVEGLIRGSQKNPKLEEIALQLRHQEYVNPIALVRGYAFIGNPTKVEQCLEAYPSLDIHTPYIACYVRGELAISALLGGQIDYYKNIIQQITRERLYIILEIAGTLGKVVHLLEEPVSEIEWFLSKVPTGSIIQILMALFRGCVQGARSDACLRFVEMQLAPHVDDTADIIRHETAIGLARAGKIMEAITYLPGLLLGDKFRVCVEAARSGYNRGAASLYNTEDMTPGERMELLLSTARNSAGALSSLIIFYDDTLSIPNDIPFIAPFAPGFSPFWSKDSVKNFWFISSQIIMLSNFYC